MNANFERRKKMRTNLKEKLEDVSAKNESSEQWKET